MAGCTLPTVWTARPALLAEGQFFYWYLANDRVDLPTLVGYDIAGKGRGRTTSTGPVPARPLTVAFELGQSAVESGDGNVVSTAYTGVSSAVA